MSNKPVLILISISFIVLLGFIAGIFYFSQQIKKISSPTIDNESNHPIQNTGVFEVSSGSYKDTVTVRGRLLNLDKVGNDYYISVIIPRQNNDLNLRVYVGNNRETVTLFKKQVNQNLEGIEDDTMSEIYTDMPIPDFYQQYSQNHSEFITFELATQLKNIPTGSDCNEICQRNLSVFDQYREANNKLLSIESITEPELRVGRIEVISEI